MSEPKKKKKKGRADKRVQVTLTEGRKPDGSQNRIAFYGRTKAEAEKKREEYKIAKKAGTLVSKPNMTVSEWLDTWSKTYDVPEEYTPYINRLKKDLGGRLVAGILEIDLYKSLSGAYGGKSKSAAQKYRMVMKQAFRKAYKNKLATEDPSEDLELPDVEEGSHRALDRWEADLIMDHWAVFRVGFWAMILLLCGLRRGELVALDWSDVDLDKRELHVNKAADLKGNKTKINDRTKTEAGMRDLPICDPLFVVLDSVPVEKRTGPVCLSDKGRRLTESAIDKGWATFCRVMTRIANGEKPIQAGRRRNSKADKFRTEPEPDKKPVEFVCTPHDLRHTYATALYDAGVDVKSAQYYLGHTDLKTTLDLYTHLSEERKNRSRTSMVDYLNSWLKKDNGDEKQGRCGQDVVIS